MIEFLLEHSPALCLAIPLLFAFIIPLVNLFGSRLRNLFVLIGLLFTEFIVLLLSHDVIFNQLRVYTMGASSPWLTLPSGMSVPIRIILQIDALSALMASIASSIALVSAIYSFRFIKGNALGKFYSLFFLMLAGMLGLIFTGDMFTMFVFFEMLSISSVALVAYWHYRKEAIEASFKYLVIGSIASLFLLFSVGLLYGQYGVLNIGALASLVKFSFTDVIALGLLVVAFAMKCGSVPMHYWVPDAYGESPTPITVMLGLSSLASLYALLRIVFTLFGAFPFIQVIAWAIICLGMLSMFVGITMALTQKDIKRLIAYSAVSQTGFILLALGVGLTTINSPYLNIYGFNAMTAGLFQLLNHAIYEALLFLSAGAIVFTTGLRDLNSLGGLARKMPFTTISFIIGMLAIAGIPPMNGFASKILIYESVYMFNPLLTVLALVVSVLTLVPFVKAFSSVFLGPEIRELRKAREVPKTMLFGMLVLGAIIVLIGLFPGIVVKTFIEPAALALVKQAQYIGGIL